MASDITDQEPANNTEYKSFEKISDAYVENSTAYTAGLQETMIHAWSDHVRDEENKGKHGEGLAEAMYSGIIEFVVKDILNHDDNEFKEIKEKYLELAKGTATAWVGFSEQALDDYLGDREKIGYADVQVLFQPVERNVGERLTGKLQEDLKPIGEKDFGSFKNYLVELAKTAGTSLPADKITDIRTAKRVLPVVLGDLAERKKSLGRSSQRLEQMLAA